MSLRDIISRCYDIWKMVSCLIDEDVPLQSQPFLNCVLGSTAPGNFGATLLFNDDNSSCIIDKAAELSLLERVNQ